MICSYRVTSTEEGFLARCLEFKLESEGLSEREAIESLRLAIEEQVNESNAVAPPSNPRPVSVTLVEAPPAPPLSPQGPGEALPDSAGEDTPRTPR